MLHSPPSTALSRDINVHVSHDIPKGESAAPERKGRAGPVLKRAARSWSPKQRPRPEGPGSLVIDVDTMHVTRRTVRTNTGGLKNAKQVREGTLRVGPCTPLGIEVTVAM
jgi:hypothetical protein